MTLFVKRSDSCQQCLEFPVQDETRWFHIWTRGWLPEMSNDWSWMLASPQLSGHLTQNLSKSDRMDIQAFLMVYLVTIKTNKKKGELVSKGVNLELFSGLTVIFSLLATPFAVSAGQTIECRLALPCWPFLKPEASSIFHSSIVVYSQCSQQNESINWNWNPHVFTMNLLEIILNDTKRIPTN